MDAHVRSWMLQWDSLWNFPFAPLGKMAIEGMRGIRLVCPVCPSRQSGQLHLARGNEYPFQSECSLGARALGIEMAKICQVSGKKGNNAKHIRHRHSGAWKFRAPKKNRLQDPNLQTVRLRLPQGTVKLTVSTKVLKSPNFAAVACGVKPIPKSWLKKPSYD